MAADRDLPPPVFGVGRVLHREARTARGVRVHQRHLLPGGAERRARPLGHAAQLLAPGVHLHLHAGPVSLSASSPLHYSFPLLYSTLLSRPSFLNVRMCECASDHYGYLRLVHSASSILRSRNSHTTSTTAS